MINDDEQRSVFAFVSVLNRPMHNLGVSIDDILAYIQRYGVLVC
jgi:hypothetical protein